MTRKLYGSARSAIDDIQSLVIESSTAPSITGVDKTILIPKLNSYSTITAKIAQNIEIVSVKYILYQTSGSWRGRVDVLFSNGTADSRSNTGQTVEDGIAFLEAWGATGVISPTGNETTTVTTSGFSYAMATKLVRKLYGSVNGQTKEIKKLYGSVNGQTKVVYSS